MIRHRKVVSGHRVVVMTEPIEPLPVSMVEAAFLTLLVAAISLPTLHLAGLLAALLTAVSVTAVAVGADKEESSALLGSAKALSEYEIAPTSHRP